MSWPRPPASLMIPALVRQVAAVGGFATVLARGDDHGSAMLVVHRDARGVRAFERRPSATGGSAWIAAAEGEAAVDGFVARQRKFDPDLWVIELDVAHPERFIPDISTAD